jgi:ATP-dependent RNA helicase DDX46/PRP5
VKPEFSSSKAIASLDDSVESKRKLEKLEDMPAIDMTMTDDTTGVGDLDADDDDDEEANRMDQAIKAKAKQAMDVAEEDDIDPLDAFMSEVKEEVKKVNLEDAQKMLGNGGGGSRIRLDERIGDEGSEDEMEVVHDELDATGLNPEDILALAAKKAKKKELATVDHARIPYEPFRKEFYNPPPDVAAMTEDEAELLRLALDGIKIRGIDCPKPVIKWSHFGLPASW